MDLSLEELSKQVLLLPSESRALLADRIAESLSAAEPEHLWTLESARRLEEIESGGVKAVPGDEVLAEIRQIVGG